MLSSGLSSFHPLARNPWELDAIPAARRRARARRARRGYGPLHLGTDIGGSIRLPAGWCGLVGLKPSAGPRADRPALYRPGRGADDAHVDDAALMMATLSRPTRATITSLPDEALDWRIAPAALEGAADRAAARGGCGAMRRRRKCAPRSSGRRAISRRRARASSRSGRFLTQDMLDGLDHFWRTRSLIDIDALPPREAREGAAVHPRLGGIGARASGEEVFRGFSQIPAMPERGGRGDAPFDYLLSPTAPMTAFPGRMGLAEPAIP